MSDPVSMQKGAIEHLIATVEGLRLSTDENVRALNKANGRSRVNRALAVVSLLLAVALAVGGYFLHRTTSELHTQTHRIDVAQVRFDKVVARLNKVVKRIDCQERQDEVRIHRSELFYIAERKKVVGQLAGLDDIGRGNHAAAVRGFLEFRQASRAYVAYVDRQLRAFGIDPATGKRLPGAKPPAKC